MNFYRGTTTNKARWSEIQLQTAGPLLDLPCNASPADPHDVVNISRRQRNRATFKWKKCAKFLQIDNSDTSFHLRRHPSWFLLIQGCHIYMSKEEHCNLMLTNIRPIKFFLCADENSDMLVPSLPLPFLAQKEKHETHSKTECVHGYHQSMTGFSQSAQPTWHASCF